MDMEATACLSENQRATQRSTLANGRVERSMYVFFPLVFNMHVGDIFVTFFYVTRAMEDTSTITHHSMKGSGARTNAAAGEGCIMRTERSTRESGWRIRTTAMES